MFDAKDFSGFAGIAEAITISPSRPKKGPNKNAAIPKNDSAFSSYVPLLANSLTFSWQWFMGMSAGFRGWKPALVLLLLMAVSLPIQASSPAYLTATEDQAAQEITLTWNYPNTLASGDFFNIYIDSEITATTTTNTYVDDVSTWTGLLRAYQVTAVISGTESEPSNIVLASHYVSDSNTCASTEEIRIIPNVPPTLYSNYLRCVLQDRNAPKEIDASFNPDGELVLTWTHIDPSSVSEYRVYVNDELLATVTDMEFTDALVGWDGSTRVYHVKAIVGTVPSGPSDLVEVTGTPTWPIASCPLVRIGVKTHFQFVFWIVDPSCIPV